MQGRDPTRSLRTFCKQQNSHLVAADPLAHSVSDLGEVAERGGTLANAVGVVDVVRGGVTPSEVHSDHTLRGWCLFQAPRARLEALDFAPAFAKVGAECAEAKVGMNKLVLEDKHELSQLAWAVATKLRRRAG